jgi:hypothetical protein
MRKADRFEEIGERVLRVLQQGEGLSWREMRNAGLKGCDKEIRRVIGGLVDRGLVLSEKSGRVTKYRLA